MKYQTQGICSTAIDIEMDGKTIKSVLFFGGCDGNHKGLSALVAGISAEEAIQKLKGIKCGPRNTSCPDQLAQILEKIIKEN